LRASSATIPKKPILRRKVASPTVEPAGGPVHDKWIRGGIFERVGWRTITTLSLPTLLGVKFLLSQRLVLGSRRGSRERDDKRQSPRRHGPRREQEAERRQSEQDHEAERWGQRQRQQPARQSVENEWWWTVLGVSPDASVDEVRRRYLQKIKQAHPDRVAWLEPESLAAAESRSKALNAAYAEAMRARRASSELGPPPNEG
jgi:hypothetical protein